MKKYLPKLYVFLGLILLFIILNIIKCNPSWAEFYATTIASAYIQTVAILFGWIPFSLYEILIIAIIVFIIYYLVRFIFLLCKKHFKQFLHKLLNCLIIIFVFINLYLGTASISYGRELVAIPQYEEEVTTQLIDETFTYFLNDYNNISKNFEREENGSIINPYTFEELNEILKEEYTRLDSNYFPTYTPNAKPLMFSSIFSELHLTGVFFAPTGEAHVNIECPPVSLPHVMAHELAHSKGVFREDDANLVALYITLTSENEYLRYSAYYTGFSSLLEIYRLTNYQKYYDSYFLLDKDIRKEYQSVNKFWEEHDFLSKIGDWFNNLYLKINGNENGTDDYIDKPDSEDTGEKDENNNPIYTINEYSPYQKLFFHIYSSQKK